MYSGVILPDQERPRSIPLMRWPAEKKKFYGNEEGFRLAFHCSCRTSAQLSIFSEELLLPDFKFSIELFVGSCVIEDTRSLCHYAFSRKEKQSVCVQKKLSSIFRKLQKHCFFPSFFMQMQFLFSKNLSIALSIGNGRGACLLTMTLSSSFISFSSFR